MYILRLTLILLFLFLVGCGSEKVEMKQSIEMGPFVFEVADASESIVGRYYNKQINVTLVLLTDKSKPSMSFDQFLNDTAGDSIIAFPAMKLVDGHGNKFMGMVRNHLGNTYTAEFKLVDDSGGSKSAAKYRDRKVSDFHLEIKNPDPRKGQPSYVTIQLR